MFKFGKTLAERMHSVAEKHDAARRRKNLRITYRNLLRHIKQEAAYGLKHCKYNLFDESEHEYIINKLKQQGFIVKYEDKAFFTIIVRW